MRGHPRALPDADLLTCLISRGRDVSPGGRGMSPLGEVVRSLPGVGPSLPGARPHLPEAGPSPLGAGPCLLGAGPHLPWEGRLVCMAVRSLLPHLRPCVLSLSGVGGEKVQPLLRPHTWA